MHQFVFIMAGRELWIYLKSGSLDYLISRVAHAPQTMQHSYLLASNSIRNMKPLKSQPCCDFIDLLSRNLDVSRNSFNNSENELKDSFL